MRLPIAVFVSIPFIRVIHGSEEMACGATADGATCTPPVSSEAPSADVDEDYDPCANLKSECYEWAAMGNCRTNEGFMKTYCPRACGYCPPIDEAILNQQEEEATATVDCTDLHELCPMWSEQGECILNPKYMTRACRESCMQCVNVRASRDRGESEDTIRRKKLYLNHHSGRNQRISGTPEEQNKIKSLLIHMHRYAKVNLTEVGVSEQMRTLCRNEFDECASWAVQGMCRKDPVYMLNNCPLACHMCDKAVKFQRCAGKSDPRKKAAFEDTGDVDKLFREGKERGRWDAFGPEYITERPWIVRFDTFLNNAESRRFIEIGNEIGWQDSALEEREMASGNPSKVPPRRTSKSAICQVGADCDADPIYSAVLDRVATVTGVSRRHIEHVELVRYDRADSFGVHHDYRVHDNWKPGKSKHFNIVCFVMPNHC